MATSGMVTQYSVGDMSVERAMARFRRWQIEILLNSAADILGRCMQDRNAAQDLLAQDALLNFSIDSDDLAIQQHRARISSGFADLSLFELRARVDMLNSLNGAHAEICGDLQSIHNKLSDKDLTLWQSRVELNKSLINRGVWKSDLDLTKEKIKRHEEESRRLLEEQIANEFMISRKKNLRKVGGSLAYKWQAERIFSRISRDFDEINDRLIVASAGMREILGSELPEYTPYYRPDGMPQSADAIDCATQWVRDAAKWMAQIAQVDQIFTVCVSLRDSVVGAAPKSFAGINKFRIPEKFFSKHRYVRMRGLSAAYIASKPQRTPIRCVVTAPKDAQVYTEKKPAPKLLNQSDVPPCLLGRVGSVHSSREPELCGAVSLINCSPIGGAGENGLWIIDIDSDGFDGELSDLILEFRLAGIPGRGFQ